MDMIPNRTVDSSRRFYARLLGLYPREFRNEFGPSMLQVFGDQCRSALEESGTRGMVFLWVRTLVDLTASVLREHIAAPHASLGLMEAVPNAPLPWKGVGLVLIPGLVFFIGQIGQLTGQDWFFLLVRRAAYYLIIPVVIVWLLTRKFPIWGLIPLGIFYRTIFDVGYRLPSISIFSGRFTDIFESPHSPMAFLYRTYPTVVNILANVAIFLKKYSTEIQILVVTVLFSTALFLVIRIARHRGFTRAAWIWTGIFMLLILVETVSALLFYWHDFQVLGTGPYAGEGIPAMLHYVASSAYFNFTLNMGFMLLILIGALLARHHRRLAILLPLGYIIPTVVLGRFDDTSFASYTSYSLFWMSVSVLAYRVLVTLIAPIWIVRSATDRAQKRAGAIAFPFAIGVLVVSHIAYFYSSVWVYDPSSVGLILYYSISPELITLAGIALAICLYQSVAPAMDSPAPARIAAETTSG
jgi:hypothetical protein